MKHLNWIICLAAIAVLSSCGASDKEVVEAYIDAYNSNNYKKMETLIGDDYHVSFQNEFKETTKKELENTMDWNAAMKGKTKVVKLKELGEGKVQTIESYTNEKNRILGCKNPNFKWTYFIEDSRIVKVVYDTLPQHTAISDARKQAFDKFNQWCSENDFDIDTFYGDANAAKVLKRALRQYEVDVKNPQ
jgi:hypothetical protein